MDNLTEKWKEYFDRRVEKYGDTISSLAYQNERSFHLVKNSVLKWIGERKGNRILDVGCGTGILSESLTSKNEVFGIDFSEKMLEYAKKRGFSKLVKSEADSLPFEDGIFDLELCISVSQHLEEIYETIRELSRTTKIGGEIIITALNKNSILRNVQKFFEKNNPPLRFYLIDEIIREFKKNKLIEIEIMLLYYPFSCSHISKKVNFLQTYLATTFAVKGKKCISSE